MTRGLPKHSHLYFDREGHRIEKELWDKRQADPSYRIVREFDNGQIQVRVIWNGKLNRLQAQSFRDTWPIFEVRAMNYRADGSLAADPNFDGQTFAHEDDAIETLEIFLEDWTKSYRTDDGRLVEVDNHLAPPPPPDPNVPTSTIKDAPEDFGAAW